MPKKLPIWDQRMLYLMQHCIDTGACDSKKDFFLSIGMHDTTKSFIIRGRRSFTIEQMVAACKKYNVSMNWIAGLDTKMKRGKQNNALLALKDAVKSIETELNRNK